MRKGTTNIIFSHDSFRDVINLFKLKKNFSFESMGNFMWEADSIFEENFKRKDFFL
jgi:hypothetical protein